MGYAGTPLTYQEWHQAVEDSARRALDEAAASDHQSGPEVDIDEIVRHLASLVESGQRGYAWWAAHHYAQILGRRGADIPRRLSEHMNQTNQPQEIAP